MPSLHAIIVPCRGRLRFIDSLTHSLERSRRITGIERTLLIVVGDRLPWSDISIRFQTVNRVVESDGPFNKSIHLNMGLEWAHLCHADLVSFLDADAVVGDRWLESAQQINWEETTRLCYRVRYSDNASPDDPVSLRIGYEAYGSPTNNQPLDSPTFGQGQPWGNSQFTMPLKHLDGLRFDEGYEGRGFEDIAFLREIQRKFGDNYRGKIMTDPDHAIYHLTHPYEPEWRNQKLLLANLERFKTT